MKISINHIKRYVDINVSVEELCERMPLAGFEIESVTREGEGISRVVMLSFKKTGVDSPEAQILLQELNDSLIAILGHNGMSHVCFDDFNQGKGFFLVGYEDR